MSIPELMPPPWLPASQSSPKGEKTCQDSRPTPVQNFTPLSFSAAEKSVTVQTNKQTKHSKLSTPSTLLYGGGKNSVYTIGGSTVHYNTVWERQNCHWALNCRPVNQCQCKDDTPTETAKCGEIQRDKVACITPQPAAWWYHVTAIRSIGVVCRTDKLTSSD